jgi:hypothetical protein
MLSSLAWDLCAVGTSWHEAAWFCMVRMTLANQNRTVLRFTEDVIPFNMNRAGLSQLSSLTLHVREHVVKLGNNAGIDEADRRMTQRQCVY